MWSAKASHRISKSELPPSATWQNQQLGAKDVTLSQVFASIHAQCMAAGMEAEGAAQDYKDYEWFWAQQAFNISDGHLLLLYFFSMQPGLVVLLRTEG